MSEKPWKRWALEGPSVSECTGLSPCPLSASPLSRASSYDPGRTRTCNPRLRRPMPYPLGHGALMSLLIMQHEKARDGLGSEVRASESTLNFGKALLRWALESHFFSECTRLSLYPLSASLLSRASSYDPGRTRSYNPRLRRPMPYPLGRGATGCDPQDV